MAVRLVREEQEEERPVLKLAPPVEVEVEPTPVEPPPPAPTVTQEDRQAVTLQALGVMTALAQIVSIRFVLILALLVAGSLTAFGERSVLAIINAGVFDILVVVPLIALALRKG